MARGGDPPAALSLAADHDLGAQASVASARYSRPPAERGVRRGQSRARVGFQKAVLVASPDAAARFVARRGVRPRHPGTSCDAALHAGAKGCVDVSLRSVRKRGGKGGGRVLRRLGVPRNGSRRSPANELEAGASVHQSARWQSPPSVTRAVARRDERSAGEARAVADGAAPMIPGGPRHDGSRATGASAACPSRCGWRTRGRPSTRPATSAARRRSSVFGSPPWSHPGRSSVSRPSRGREVRACAWTLRRHAAIRVRAQATRRARRC